MEHTRDYGTLQVICINRGKLGTVQELWYSGTMKAIGTFCFVSILL